MEDKMVKVRNRVKLFANLSDDEVNQELFAWRNLQNYFSDNYQYVTDNMKDDENKKLIKNVRTSSNRLSENRYKNPRLELKRWHELYKSIESLLRLANRNFCGVGKYKVEDARNLYNHKRVDKDIKFKITGSIQVKGVPGASSYNS